MQENERIVKLVCGWKNTCILTDKGRLFLNSKFFKKENKENIRYKQKTKAKRDSLPLNNLWMDITHTFSQINHKFTYQIKNVFLGKFNISVLGIFRGRKELKAKSLEIQPPQKKKINPADKVLSKLKYNPEICQDDYTIGYKDISGIEELRYIELVTSKFNLE